MKFLFKNSRAVSANDLALRFAAIILVGFSAAVIYHYALENYFGATFPYSTFLYDPSDYFADFLTLKKYVLTSDPYQLENRLGYGPLAVWIVSGLTSLSREEGAIAFAIPLVIANFICALKFLKPIRKSAWPNQVLVYLAIFALAYPVLFELDRSNVESISFLFATLAVVAFVAEYWYLAVALICAAAAVKIYTLLLLLLFLPKQKKYFFSGLLFFLVVNLFCFGALSIIYDISLTQLLGEQIDGVLHYAPHAGYQINIYASRCGHSIIAGFSMLLMQWVPPEFYQIINLSLTALSALLGFLTVFLITFSNQKLWVRLTLICLSMSFFQGISYDYNLIYFLLPICLMISAAEKDRLPRWCYLPLVFLIPIKYYALGGVSGISCVIYPVVCILIISVVASSFIKNRRLKESWIISPQRRDTEKRQGN